jgi:hypothetical protein
MKILQPLSEDFLYCDPECLEAGLQAGAYRVVVEPFPCPTEAERGTMMDAPGGTL